MILGVKRVETKSDRLSLKTEWEVVLTQDSMLRRKGVLKDPSDPHWNLILKACDALSQKIWVIFLELH